MIRVTVMAAVKVEHCQSFLLFLFMFTTLLLNFIWRERKKTMLKIREERERYTEKSKRGRKEHSERKKEKSFD
jgi:preprotein translocase subunit SecG